MNTKSIALAAIAVGSLAVTGVARAQELDRRVPTSKPETLAPAKDAIELTIGTGYAQGFGEIGTNQPKLTDVGQPGGAVQIGVGYRLIPPLALGVYGSGGMFSRADRVDSSTNLYTSTAGVQADWHFLPSQQEIDPWVSLGTGWRGYWMHNNVGTTSLHGLELAKLQVGVDYRVAQAVAISPVIGADMSMFLTQANPTSGGFTNIASPMVNTFLFGGLMGRFDIPAGSQRSSEVARR